MTDYTYTDKPLNNELFVQQLEALALPGGATWERVYLGQPGQYQHVISTPQVLSAANKTRLDTMVAAHDFTQRTASQSASDAMKAAEAAADAQDATDHATLATFDTMLANYLALASPTAAQTTAIVQAQARAWRYILRRLQRQGLV